MQLFCLENKWFEMGIFRKNWAKILNPCLHECLSVVTGHAYILVASTHMQLQKGCIHRHITNLILSSLTGHILILLC